ncbi:MAG: hypothetical protein IT260_04070 [Saprospiraceae bacterium]|nr:hypothetical protein [Saprospiraceae bacterium]
MKKINAIKTAGTLMGICLSISILFTSCQPRQPAGVKKGDLFVKSCESSGSPNYEICILCKDPEKTVCKKYICHSEGDCEVWPYPRQPSSAEIKKLMKKQ